MMRLRLLEGICGKMTDEDRRLLVRTALERKDCRDIMAALENQGRELSDIRRRQQTFKEDFLSNILGNALWGGLSWLAGRVLKK